MKKLAIILTLIGVAFAADAAPKKPQTWKERAAARFKPMTTEQKNAIREALPSSPTARPKKNHRVLVFYRCETFIHTSIPHGNYCLQEMGEISRAFTADLADEYSVFSKENLAKYDAVIFNNTTSVAFENDAQRDALMDFVKQGKGIVGIHAAGDSFYKWKLALLAQGRDLPIQARDLRRRRQPPHPRLPRHEQGGGHQDPG
jgi:hypothetical protein